MSTFNSNDYSSHARSNIQLLTRNLNFLSKDFESPTAPVSQSPVSTAQQHNSPNSQMNLHNKASSVSFLDFNNNSPGQFGRAPSHNPHNHLPFQQNLSLSNHGSSTFNNIKPQTVNASPSTAMAILSPPASRYAFDKSSVAPLNTSATAGPTGINQASGNANPSFFNPNSKSNYSNLGNDWSLNLNFSLSNNLNSSNPELSSLSSGAGAINNLNNNNNTGGDVTALSSASGHSQSNTVSGRSTANNSSSANLNSSPEVESTTFENNVCFLKKWLDDSKLEEKHMFIDELIDYFLFTPNHSSDLINYLKLKIDRISFNDDLDSPTTANMNNNNTSAAVLGLGSAATSVVGTQNPIHSLHSQQQSMNNLDTILSNTSLDYNNATGAGLGKPADFRMPQKNFGHSKSNSVSTHNIALSNENNNNNNNNNGTNTNSGVSNGQLKQTVLSVPASSKDLNHQPQVFSPLLTESGFLQNQAIRYANGNRNHHSHSRSHSKSASISNMSVNTNNPSNVGSNNEMLNGNLMSPIHNSSFGSKRGNNSLSINTSGNGSSVNGPSSATVSGSAASAALSPSTNPAQTAGNGASNITSPTSPITPGGYNLDALDPQTRLKLQALSTINSRSKLDALKKTIYSDQSRGNNVSGSNNSNSGPKNYKANGFNLNKNGATRNMPNSNSSGVNKYDDSISNSPSVNRKKFEKVNGSGNLNHNASNSISINSNTKKVLENGSGNNSTDSLSKTGNVKKFDEGISTPVGSKINSSLQANGNANKNLANALMSLQTASNETAAVLNKAQNTNSEISATGSGSIGTPSKQLSTSTLSLLSPKSPGLNSLELIELKNLNDLPVWLKNLRLHKYTKILENYSWKQLIYLSDDELESVGVTALGARRKLLKAFDIVKVAYENGDIIGLDQKN